MRKYQTPETKSLNMQAQSMICAGSPSPAPTAPERMSLPNVVKTSGTWTLN